MTKQVIRKIAEEALNISAVEEALVEIAKEELCPCCIATVIWELCREEIIEAVAEVAVEKFLPF